jgi:hypothetical protein
MASEPIKFTITNPCSGPSQITAPATLPTQEYTITQDELTFEFDPWTVSPSLCGGEITYTYEASNNKIKKKIVKSFSSADRTFTLYNNKNIGLADGDEKKYTITVTGTVGTDSPVSSSQTFDLWIKDPCINPDYLKVEASLKDTSLTEAVWDLWKIEYNSASELIPAVDNFKFEVQASNKVKNLCGDTDIKSKIRGAEVTLESEPLRWAGQKTTYYYYSEDED